MQQINDLKWQTNFRILIGHEQWVVTDFALFLRNGNQSLQASVVYFIPQRRFVFVDRNGVSFEKHQAASNLLHLSEYLSYN